LSHRFVLIGHPVGHSISPVIHQRAYDLLGVVAHYSLADCPTEKDVANVVEQIRRGELRGANVTVPWKQVAFDLADHHHQTALDVGVANVLARSPAGEIIAYNTDASALGSELRRATADLGSVAEERPAALVIGSGGAALAAVVGCRLAGMKEIYVSARRFDPSVHANTWPRGPAFERLGARLLAWPTFDAAPWQEVLPRTQLIVQATSAGMHGTQGGDELADMIPWSSLRGAVAYDLVYNPPETPFLKRAGEAGLRTVGGLGMLVGQAADAIEIWLGQAPPLPELMGTAQKALGL
jgi:shikimate dehydrogenase